MHINLKIKSIIAAGILASGMVTAGALNAEIYRYQDKSGNWHFSDTPPAGAESRVDVLTDAVGKNEHPENLAQELADRFSPATCLPSVRDRVFLSPTRGIS